MSSKGKSDAATGGGAGLVPKRRFPEFGEAEAWKPKRLSRFLSESRLAGSKGDVAKKITVKLWGGGVFAKNDAIQGSANTQYFRRKSGQLIYSKLDFLNQAFGIIPEELDGYESTVDLPCFDVSAGVNDAFLLECVKRKEFYLRVGEAADGSRIAKRIHPETFLASEIPLPSLLEQNKIADCLNSEDALIAAQGRKVEALKAHKKGLMQQLFPQEGETQPRLRFPEFEGAGEWEETPLSELFSSLDAGVSVNSGDRPAQENEVGVLKTSAVTNGFFNLNENKVVFDDFEISRVREPVCGDTIIISRMNTPALVGANAYVKTGLENIFLPDRLWAAKPRTGTCMPFVALILGSDEGRAALSKLAKGSSGSMKNISKSDVLAFLIKVPSPPEQQRIADCLTSLDDLIAAESQKLATLKIHKKGLMQQLFPQVGEDDA
ncbi:restriction endonuclease subunit S [Azospirillum griseum]|uniref:Restriction endonuclease subunit S n=1 Tax=Azospirillum griseum TaxID=2496639 RepID=A0A3S0JE30_9PROT|nr:restriction endonuclease subunit S [Azospirillum griseum]RTR13435.1 restriction endonuclease subunit S [Azospirillum griseum]